MKLDLNHLSAILAIDPATATHPTPKQVDKNTVVVGTLPPQLIQLCSYQSNIIQTANARISEIKAQVDRLEVDGATHRTEIDSLIKEVRALHKFAGGYQDFFWFCVKQHFELEDANQQLSIGENWSVISGPSVACSCANAIIEQFFGHDAQISSHGQGFFVITPGSPKNKGE